MYYLKIAHRIAFFSFEVGVGEGDISKSRSGVLDFIKLEEGEQLLRPLLKVGVRFVESKWVTSVMYIWKHRLRISYPLPPTTNKKTSSV